MLPTIVKRVLEFNRGRDPALVELKIKKMAKSPFCFFRGTDHLFATSWRKLEPISSGPPVLCCGDLHLENFGIYAADDGKTHFGINDFDEAFVGPASFDLVRCVTSIFLAAEDWKLLPVQSANLSLEYIASYKQAIVKAVQRGRPGDIILGQRRQNIFDLISDHLSSPPELLNAYTEHSENGKRRIIRDKKHFKLKKGVRRLIDDALDEYGQRHRIAKEYQVLDATGRIAGIGSLGVKRYCVLIRDKGSDFGHRLLDVKAVGRSSVKKLTIAEQPTFGGNQAHRVVEAQRQIQGISARGLDVLRIGREDFRMREMIPDENRYSLDAFQERPSRLLEAVQQAGRITGWAHFRGCTPPVKATQRRLAQWVAGPDVHEVLVAAVRFADRTKQQFKSFLSPGLDRLKQLAHRSTRAT